jgi:very-short-patch-repair endonuclease
MARTASQQHGVVSRGQLTDSGVSVHMVDNLLKASRLRPVHRGVYQVGPIAGPRAREMAALLACAGTAAVSHWSAAALWLLLSAASREAAVHVILPGRRRPVRSGITVHSAPMLARDEVTQIEGIAVTTVARTLLDLAAVAAPRELERAMAQAEREHRVDSDELLELIRRYPRHRGSGRLRAMIQQGGAPALTRSEAEDRLLALIRKAQLRPPEANVRVEGYEVDLFWRAERLVVEVDGFAFHASQGSFESDRRRDATLAARGVQVVRVTWRQITGEPEALLVRLALTLARPR